MHRLAIYKPRNTVYKMFTNTTRTLVINILINNYVAYLYNIRYLLRLQRITINIVHFRVKNYFSFT